MTSDPFPPLQLKGEIMDLEFTVDTDHRCQAQEEQDDPELLELPYFEAQVRPKTTMSETGLCVYEIDDPALRDDPTLDETTRLRNRIAELESLVRELRGKPHPRWAESSFRDGDPNEKWHSRAAKCLPGGKRRALSPELVQDNPPSSHSTNGRSSGVLSTLLSPIKTETVSDPSSQLYRFSPSPAPSMRYHTFQADVRSSPVESSGGQRSPAYRSPNSTGSYQSSVPPTSSPYAAASGHPASAPSSSYSDGGSSTGATTYPLSGSDDGRPYSDHYSARDSPPHSSSYCVCRTNQAVSHSYLALSQQVQSTLHTVRQYNHHPANTRCVIYRRIVELNSLLQQTRGNESNDCAGPAYDSNTPTDSEILTPASSSSGPTSFHASSSPGGGVSPHEWTATMSPNTYNPYFPMPQSESHSMYAHVMS
ncbi:hypothetical protein V5O48_007091 [Marasmius crinis-equi]|uniref:Uncharacterized protein n=1 Tax=Marasmius crinis-equi TaxID=585013 RepID=A0ABR3FHN9_9AGAR